MKTIIFAAAIVMVSSASFAGVYDNPTPAGASAINRALHCYQPQEPLADTTREGMIRATSNGGGS